MRTLIMAGLAGGAAAAAMAGALLAAAPTRVTTTRPPPATANPAGAPLVLAGRGRRPVWAFVVQAPDRSGDRGSATLEWAPRGRQVCPDGPVPLGRRQTDVTIVIHSPEVVGGRALATIGPAPADCRRAVGTWRGIDGTLEDQAGSLELTVDDSEIVRVQLDG